MGNTSLISKILTDPHQLTDAEKESVNELTETYPYFVPLRYAREAIRSDDAKPTHIKELYVANWLLYRELVQKQDASASAEAIAGEGNQSVTIAEHAPDTDKQIEEETAYAEALASHGEAQNIDLEETNKEETTDNVTMNNEDQLIVPVYTEDYFLHQGVQVSDKIPAELDYAGEKEEKSEDQDPKSLMVMMSFTEWLMFYKTKKQKETEEEQERKALKTMWQKEKLAAALEEETEEIPEDVFKMAVDSISKEDGLVSESLAEIHYKQGKHDKAIDMYRKLSLRNPQKKAYFARKIDEILKNKH